MNALVWLSLACLTAAGPWRLAEPGRRLVAPAVSRDGHWAAVRVTGAEPEPDAVAVVDLLAGRPAARVTLSSSPSAGPVWLPGNRLAVAAADGFELWEAAGAGELRRWPATLVPTSLAAAGAVQRLAAATPTGVVVLDALTGATVARLDTQQPVVALAFDDSGEVLVTAEAPAAPDAGSVVTCWQVAGAVRRAVHTTAAVQALATAGPSRALVSAGAGGLWLWDLATLAPQRAVVSSPATALAASADTPVVAVGRGAGEVWLASLNTGRAARVALPHGAPGGYCLAGGQLLAAAGDTLHLLAAATEQR